MSDNSLTMRLALDAGRWSRDWHNASRTTKTASGQMSRHVGEVNRVVRGIRNNLAALGISFGAVHQIAQSARLDKSLILTKQTAGATKTQIDALRESLFDMAGETGQTVENLKGGFDQLIQAGLNFESAFSAIPEINRTMAVSGAEAETLAKALTVASNLFEFDLTSQGQAAKLLDKMVVAGVQGNVELENLADAFAKVGAQAKLSGLNFEQTLALLEAMSLKEPDVDRLSTAMQSAMRIFTDQNYKKKVSAAMGISMSDLFYNSDNTRRDVYLVLDDIAKRMDSMTDEKSLDRFVQRAFGETSKQTREGLINILTGGTSGVANQFARELQGASGIVKNNLEESMDNSVTQAARVRNLLRKAADDFSKPINKTLADLIQFATGKKSEGGLGLDGEDMLWGAGGAAALLLAGKKFGPQMLRKFSGGALGTAGGVAIGKSLEATAGVTPVYVVNMPGAGIGGGAVDAIIGGRRGGLLRGGSGGVLKTIGFNQLRNQSMGNLLAMGRGALLRAGGFVSAAGVGGWLGGTALNKAFIEGKPIQDKIGGTILQMMANIGIDSAKESINRRLSTEAIRRELDAFSQYKSRNPESKLTIRIVEDKEGRSRVEYMRSEKGLDLDVTSGPAMSY